MKVTRAIITNYTSDDFNTHYVNQSEYELYNRIWTPENYVEYGSNDKVQVMTNIMITPNQTMTTCPSSPLVTEAWCDPEHPICKAGRQRSNSVETGKCIMAQFPYYNETLDQWLRPYVCEVHGKYQCLFEWETVF